MFRQIKLSKLLQFLVVWIDNWGKWKLSSISPFSRLCCWWFPATIPLGRLTSQLLVDECGELVTSRVLQYTQYLEKLPHITMKLPKSDLKEHVLKTTHFVKLSIESARCEFTMLLRQCGNKIKCASYHKCPGTFFISLL